MLTPRVGGFFYRQKAQLGELPKVHDNASRIIMVTGVEGEGEVIMIIGGGWG